MTKASEVAMGRTTRGPDALVRGHTATRFQQDVFPLFQTKQQVPSLGIIANKQNPIVSGLTAALYGEITIERGKVVQSNFHDYEMLRMSEMPEVELYIVRNHEEPGGVGEPAVPPIAPAVANAIFALTGQRIRKLPVRLT